MKIEHKNNLLYVQGKPFKIKTVDNEMKFIPVKNKDVEKKLVLVDKLSKKLKDSLDQEKVMKEALMNLHFDYLKKLDKMLNSKRKYEPKTRDHHCADMKVGNFVIPIVK